MFNVRYEAGDVRGACGNSGGTDFCGNTRHAVHEATRLILGDGATSAVVHLEQATRAIAPHAGENDTDGGVTVGLRDGRQENVGGRLLEVDRRAVVQGDIAQGRRQVLVARRDVDVSGA